MIELVVLDEQGGRIQCTVKSIHVYLFENSINEDVLGVVTGKGNLIEFKKEGKPCNYVVIELENIEGGLKLRCTLWEDYAFMFLKHLEDHPSESYVVVLQFAKMKNFNGINTNLLPKGIQFSQLSDHASLTLEEEFLERGVYKSIADLKEVTQNSVFVTIGTVKDIESEYNWCYRAYSASFILFDKEASNFLKIPAYELRTSYIAKGGNKNRHLEEIDSFKDKKFLFKVQVKIQDMESIVPYVISISRLCFEDNIIASFEKKYQIEEVALIQDNSELLSQFTESSDLLKDNLSVSCDNGVDTPSPLLPTGKTASNMDSSVIKVLDVDLAEYCGNASFDTPSKCKGEMHSEQTIVRVAVHGDEQSAKKLRKVIKEEKN
ncbi:Nucleic acid-binding, OB-fold [Sesbania bispinosa]|nr:Nucleic acid-binding, OB-fold [Sesbania bispinosa]